MKGKSKSFTKPLDIYGQSDCSLPIHRQFRGKDMTDSESEILDVQKKERNSSNRVDLFDSLSLIGM